MPTVAQDTWLSQFMGKQQAADPPDAGGATPDAPGKAPGNAPGSAGGDAPGGGGQAAPGGSPKPRLSDADREARTQASTRLLQAKAQQQIAAEHEADLRRRLAKYKPLQDQYKKVRSIVATVMKEPAEGAAAGFQQALRTEIGFAHGMPPASSKIEALLASVRDHDTGLDTVDAQALMRRTGVLVNQYVQASLANTHIPGFWPNLVTAVDLSKDQITEAARLGMDYYNQLLADEAFIETVLGCLNAVKVTGTLMRDVYVASAAFATFITTVDKQIAAANASAAIFGPAAPGIAYALILAETFAAIGNEIVAIGKVCDLILYIATGKQMDPGIFTVGEAFGKPKEILGGYVKQAGDVKKNIDDFKAGMAKMTDVSGKVRAYIEKHGHG